MGTVSEMNADSPKDARGIEQTQHPHARNAILLKTPVITVDGTPEEWLSKSRIVDQNSKMTSRHDDSSVDDTTSSLGDSNYDFIDDRSVVTTDDEDHDAMTASITSSDGFDVEQRDTTGSDDVEPNNYRGPAGSHGDFTESLKTPTSRDCEAPAVDFKMPSAAAGAALTAPSEPIVFEEPSVVDLKTGHPAEASHLLKIIERPKWGHLRRISVTACQTMSSHSLDIGSKSYNVLYIGPEVFKEPIVQKVGTALASKGPTPSDLKLERSNKFNVVPISAFGEAQPEVVLIGSSGLEISIEESSSIQAIAKKDRSRAIRLLLQNGRHIDSHWDGKKYVLSEGWEIPNIAIFCWSGDMPKHENMITVKQFMDRHRINVLHITDCFVDRSPLLLGHIDRVLPHLCLDILDPAGKPCYQWCVPIDLHTFLNIDAGQMNRNLAYAESVATHLRSKGQAESPNIGDIYDITRETLHDMWKRFYRFVQESPNATSFLVFLLVGVFSSFLLANLGISFRQLTLPAGPNSPAYVVSECPSSMALSTALSSTSSVPVASLRAETSVSTPLQSAAPTSISTNTDIAAFLLDVYPSPPNQSELFKVHVLGDCHVILRPPQWFVKTKKAPPLIFQISRGKNRVVHQVSTPFDGVFALQIPREEAYGLLDVRIRTEAKPLVDEGFQVDFGSSWLKIAAWKRASRALTAAMQHDLNLVQTSLSIVYNHTKAEISTFVWNRKAMRNQSDAQQRRASSQQSWSSKTRFLLLSQSRDISQVLSNKLHVAQKATSKQMHALTKDFQMVSRELQTVVKDLQSIANELSQDVIVPVRGRLDTASHRTRTMFKTASQNTPIRLGEGFRGLRQRWRDSQKSALKLWWRVRGLPTYDKAGTKRQEDKKEGE